jgi:hypothetical protein
MPYLEVTEEKRDGPVGDVYDVLRELLAREKAKHPEWRFKDSAEFRDAGSSVTAILGYSPRLDYVAPEPEPEPEVVEEQVEAIATRWLAQPDEEDEVVEEVASATCVAVKTDGTVCGRDLPCPYSSHRAA